MPIVLSEEAGAQPPIYREGKEASEQGCSRHLALLWSKHPAC